MSDEFHNTLTVCSLTSVCFANSLIFLGFPKRSLAVIFKVVPSEFIDTIVRGELTLRRERVPYVAFGDAAG